MRGRRKVVALANVSLEVACGELAAIYGPSRSGKTTLLRIAAGLESADSGAVTYDGQPVSSMSDRELAYHRRKRLGCVWTRQRQIPGFDVLDSVALPLALESGNLRSSRQTAHEFLTAVGAVDCAEAAMHELSDGERRRVEIAQAVVTKPQLLLADEPTAGLGPLERDSILELLKSLASEAKIAVLISGAHSLDVLRASPIIGIDEGRLVRPELPRREPGRLIELRGGSVS